MSEEKQTVEQNETEEQEVIEEQAAAEEQQEETNESELLQNQINELQGLLEEKENKLCVFKQTLKTINDAAV